MMTKIAAIFLLVLSPHNCLGFTGPPSPVARAATQLFAGQQPTTTTASLAGFMTGAVGLIGQAMAAEELEYAELPPPYVPAIFGIVLLVGVGVLTSSLGNVMDEEASLGMQSGARAKKEIERSRSSYFGKRPR